MDMAAAEAFTATENTENIFQVLILRILEF